MLPAELNGTPEVSHGEVLKARENRAALQLKLVEKHGLPVVSFTLNIAGAHKVFPLAEKAFEEGECLIEQRLRLMDIPIHEQREQTDSTGYLKVYSVSADPYRLKGFMCEIEESCTLGRLFDIDVTGVEGVKISREDIGREKRKCFLCENEAHACARSRAHSIDSLQREMVRIIRRYFDEGYAENIAKTAVRALFYELAVTPKPGLVDRQNSGAHIDMDFYTFIDSAVELAPYFRLCALKGASHVGGTDTLLDKIRFDGKCAEKAMYRVTSGINTHKGAIFSLGILSAAIGFLYGRSFTVDAKTLSDTCAAIAAPALEDFKKTPGEETTNGRRLFDRYCIAGVRGEAASGFSTVIEHGLPVLRRLLSEGFSKNEAGVITLIHLMSCAKDTNILSRSGFDSFEQIRELTRALLSVKTPKELVNSLYGIDQDFIHRNISPGGCADLLAVTWMMYLLIYCS